MRNFLSLIALPVLFYGCLELSGKEPVSGQNTTNEPGQRPPEHLRVSRDQAKKMRKKRGDDDASVKISAADLLSLIPHQVTAEDSLIFYFVKYDPSDPEQEQRYMSKKQRGSWKDVAKKPSSLLVGYMKDGSFGQRVQLLHRPGRSSVALYDLGVVCPPPPDCDCEIE